MTTGPDFAALLETAIEREGLRGFARRASLSPTFVWRVRHGTAQPSPNLLRALGWERVVTYRPIHPSPKGTP